MSVAGPTGAAGRAGPCVGALRVRGLLGVTGLAVGWPAVCSAGLRVPAGRLAWAVVAAAVRGAAPGCVLPLGAGIPGMPRAAAEDGAGCAGVAARGWGTPEAVGSSGVPAVAAGARASVLGAGPAGAAAGPALAAEVPVARVTAEAVAAPLSSDV